MSGQGAYRLSQLRFNTLLNEHFPWLIFHRRILSRRKWRGRGELLLKNGTIDGYAY